MVLNKDDLIFQRDEKGKLLAVEVELENIEGKPRVKVRPLTRGKIQELYTKAKSDDDSIKLEADTEIIRSGLVEPILTEEEILDMKPNYATAVSIAILSASLGVSQEEVKEKAQNLIESEEENLKKK